ncbi:hypothetical protein ABBQ38_004563 [Trebouxia sp. C0009 RCD-2024]
MSATYNLKLVKANFASIDCIGKVTSDAFVISRKGGEVLFKLPLDSLLTAAQPSPQLVEVQARFPQML